MINKVSNDDCPHGCNSAGNILFKGEWIPCPIHGVKGRKMADKAFYGVSDEKAYAFKKLNIPLEIQDTLSKSSQTLEVLKICATTDKLATDSLDYVLQGLQRLEEACEQGKILLESCYFYLGSWVNLVPYVYSLQVKAFDKGIAQVPVFTISDIKALSSVEQVLGSTNNISKESLVLMEEQLRNSFDSISLRGIDIIKYTGTQFSDILTVPILFLLDSKAVTVDEIQFLESVLRRRGAKNLPTYIFSNCFPDRLRSSYLMDCSYLQRLSKVSPYVVTMMDKFKDACKYGFYNSPGPLDI